MLTLLRAATPASSGMCSVWQQAHRTLMYQTLNRELLKVLPNNESNAEHMVLDVSLSYSALDAIGDPTEVCVPAAAPGPATGVSQYPVASDPAASATADSLPPMACATSQQENIAVLTTPHQHTHRLQHGSGSMRIPPWLPPKADLCRIEWEGFTQTAADELYHTVWSNARGTHCVSLPFAVRLLAVNPAVISDPSVLLGPDESPWLVRVQAWRAAVESCVADQQLNMLA